VGQNLGTVKTDPVEGRVGEGIAVHELERLQSACVNSLVIPRQLLRKEVPSSGRSSNLGQLT